MRARRTLDPSILAAGYAMYDDLVRRGWREPSEPQPQTYWSLRDTCEQEYSTLFGSGGIEVDRCVLRAGEARHLKTVQATRHSLR